MAPDPHPHGGPTIETMLQVCFRLLVALAAELHQRIEAAKTAVRRGVGFRGSLLFPPPFTEKIFF